MKQLTKPNTQTVRGMAARGWVRPDGMQVSPLFAAHLPRRSSSLAGSAAAGPLASVSRSFARLDPRFHGFGADGEQRASFGLRHLPEHGEQQRLSKLGGDCCETRLMRAFIARCGHFVGGFERDCGEEKPARLPDHQDEEDRLHPWDATLSASGPGFSLMRDDITDG